MSNKRYKFCASCYNYVNSCDCLGNLSDHDHLTPFERPGKEPEDKEDHDDMKEEGEVWYFRAQIGVSLNEFGTLGVGAALRIPEMWTKVPPENPELYLSIPVERMDNFNAVNVAPFGKRPEMFTPKFPWEIQFFTTDGLIKNTKTDAQIAQELKDCLKKAVKKKLGRLARIALCHAAAAFKKTSQFFNPDAEAMYDAVDDFLPDNIEGYYALIPYVGYVAPDRLVENLEQQIIPGWGHLWIDQHLFDGNDPVNDSHSNYTLLSNVQGVQSFWNDNTTGGGEFNYEDYYGNVTDPNTQARMLTMPYVPPPVQPPSECDSRARSSCEPRPPSYPPDRPPYPPEDPVEPPFEPPETVGPEDPKIPPENDGEIFNLYEAPWTLVQLPIWELPGAVQGGEFDYRNYPHLDWGPTANQLFPPTDGVYKRDLILKTIPEQIGPKELKFRWYYLAETNANQVFNLLVDQQVDNAGNLVGAMKHVWTIDEIPSFRAITKLTRQYRLDVTVPTNTRRGNLIRYYTFKCVIDAPGAQQEFKLRPFSSWDPLIEPKVQRINESLIGAANGGDDFEYTFVETVTGPPAQGVEAVEFRSFRNPTAFLDVPRQFVIGAGSPPYGRPNFPVFFLGTGECNTQTSGSFIPTNPIWVHKNTNTGDGGLTPFHAADYVGNSRPKIGRKQGSDGSVWCNIYF